MSGQFEVEVQEVRAHAQTVATVASQVGDAVKAGSVGGGAFGAIGEFFASAITAAGDQVRGDIGRAAQAVIDVRAGLDAVAELYRQVDDAQARLFGGEDAKVTPVQSADPPYPTRQRAKAEEVLRRIARDHPISAAAVALGPVHDARWWVGEIASATIGDHYEKDVAHLLRDKPTNATLKALADGETDFWKSERGNWVGAMMPASMRYSMLVDSRTEWLNAMPPADRDRIAKELGVQLKK
ncbi:type VII secretion target [Actinokineospora sp. NBRC 105648]|uniref:type VII secretion target n=1 Tax=Actinokineospora sp. NBRC 105648 TaxID=3032206 RepID=UPI0024A5EDA0|nr:type VII secretion target [Actinokineospora sp. NBRC 105648]GLZ43479.1 hypothetical protein Acsp05_71030 [Actinokineospora sp. NBRC 105648]